MPLAAVFVFDYSAQETDFNITAENVRSLQLRVLSDWNRKHRRRLWGA